MAKIPKIVLVVFSFIAVMAALTLTLGTRGMKEIRDYTIGSVDLTSKSDGTYSGTLARTRWGMSVRVTVQDHVITGIEITDRKSSNLTKTLINRLNPQLINTATPSFDAVSGATMTSKGYLIAVANALK